MVITWFLLFELLTRAKAEKRLKKKEGLLKKSALLLQGWYQIANIPYPESKVLKGYVK